MTTAAQRSSQLPLNLRDARWRPVMSVNGVMCALDISAEEVDQLIDAGSLIGFNIAVDAGGRRELRILTRSVQHYRAVLDSRPLDLSWKEIARNIFPHDKPFLAGTEIDAALNCDPDHRMNLIRAGELSTVKAEEESAWRRGPGGSPNVARESFEEFLKRRETSRQFLKRRT